MKNMPHRWPHFLCSFLMMIYCAAGEAETDWNLARDFPGPEATDRSWSFGFSSYGSPVFNPLSPSNGLLGLTGLNGWAATKDRADVPLVARNESADPVGIFGFTVPAGQVLVHPGHAAARSGYVGEADVACVRWTAPAPGVYGVIVSADRLHPEATAMIYVLRNFGTPQQKVLSDGQAIPAGAAASIDIPGLDLQENETLDFLVWASKDGPEKDAIGLSVQITALTAEQQLASFVKSTSVQLAVSHPGRIFSTDDPVNLEVSIDSAQFASTDVIAASLECVDEFGKSFPIPPVSLTSGNGFKTTIPLSLPPGYFRLNAKAELARDTATHPLNPVAIDFAVLGAVASAAHSERNAAIGSQPAVTLNLDGKDWKIATDPQNAGREQQWFNGPTADAKPTKVPWIIQDVFPEYHGVAWYWREFTPPANPHADGRFILRFLAVDYLAEVWVNGIRVGQHEGPETPFELDVTDAVKPGQANLLAVRVLNPTNEPIDGISLGDVPRSAKNYPLRAATIYNVGGIVDSVELLAVPSVRVENLHAIPDWKTGRVKVVATLRNAGKQPLKVLTRIAIAPAKEGETIQTILLESEAPPGDTRVVGELTVPQWRLWSIDDPFLYRVSVLANVAGSPSIDERSTRCGFRDFRYVDGSYQLNGKRIYLQGALMLPMYPVGFRVAPNEDYVRRDVVAWKAMGLNICRIIWGGLRARDLDVFDELGILVQQEHYGAVHLADGPGMPGRFDNSIGGVIRRDRNHPSIVIWGVLNEILDNAHFRHAASSLPRLKHLDDTRVYSLNSGGFDLDMSQGSLSNPGAKEWQHLMGNESPDGPKIPFSWPAYAAMVGGTAPVKSTLHPYQSIPHTAAEIERMRTLGSTAPGRKIVISEIGTGCAVNLPRFARHYEQMGATHSEDARYYRARLDEFLRDWKAWKLDRIWTRPEDFFVASEQNMLKLRRETGNALRANPHLAGYLFCAGPDSDFNGVGLLNLFREYKPGVVELQNDLTAPVRWSLFASPVNLYSGSVVKLEAVLSNLNVMSPGDYPARAMVVAPDGRRVFEEDLVVTIPRWEERPEFVHPVLSKEVKIEGPTGTYKFIVEFQQGVAAAGEEITFEVFDAKTMPVVSAEVVLWGKDDELAGWLADHGMRTRPFTSEDSNKRELILVGKGSGDVADFRALANRMARGSTVIFLTPSVFSKDQAAVGGAGLLGGFPDVALEQQQLAALPLADKGTLTPSDSGGYYRGDTFAVNHPVFEGLPAGGILDYTVFRNIITQGGIGLKTSTVPSELIVGGIRAQVGYGSVVQMAEFRFGAGRFFFNTLRIRENLGKDPAAELLLRNLLNHAARDLDKPAAARPADFDKQLQAIGYE